MGVVGNGEPYFLDRILCGFSACECDECVAAVRAGHRIHHQSQVPNGAAFLE